jgi:hypothetical protein
MDELRRRPQFPDLGLRRLVLLGFRHCGHSPNKNPAVMSGRAGFNRTGLLAICFTWLQAGRLK